MVQPSARDACESLAVLLVAERTAIEGRASGAPAQERDEFAHRCLAEGLSTPMATVHTGNLLTASSLFFFFAQAVGARHFAPRSPRSRAFLRLLRGAARAAPRPAAGLSACRRGARRPLPAAVCT